FLLHVDDRVDHLARLRDVPTESQRPLAVLRRVETKVTIPRIDALREPRHDVHERFVLAEKQLHRLERGFDLEADARVVGALADEIRSDVGKPAVLDPEHFTVLAAVKEVDDRRDGRAVRRVDGAVRVVRRGEEMTVAALAY